MRLIHFLKSRENDKRSNSSLSIYSAFVFCVFRFPGRADAIFRWRNSVFVVPVTASLALDPRRAFLPRVSVFPRRPFAAAPKPGSKSWLAPAKNSEDARRAKFGRQGSPSDNLFWDSTDAPKGIRCYKSQRPGQFFVPRARSDFPSMRHRSSLAWSSQSEND